MIERVVAEDLQEDILRNDFYPDLGQTRYWAESGDPLLYVGLARAGFISITTQHPHLGEVLLAELQASYAVLDWKDLHASRKLRKLMRSGRLEEDGIELHVVESIEKVLARLIAYHGRRTWIRPAYRALLRRLERAPASGFTLHGVELWSRRENRCLGGELGYSLGATYTSLSGFCSPNEARWRHFGTLQIYLLAERLRDRGYAFWNMGHPHMPYKIALGARVLPRRVFLDRWLAARDLAPHEPLTTGD